MRRTTHPREKATNTGHTPTHEATGEEAAEEGEAEATTPKDIDGTPHQKKYHFFSRPRPPQRRGSHFFPRRVDLMLQKLLLKTQNKMNTWEHQQNTQTKTCKS